MKTRIVLLVAAALLVATIGALAGVHFVDMNSTNATPPYINWTTAATNVQDAVDAAVAGDEVVVTNGVYAAGGRAVVGTMTNRVAVDKPLTLRSVNGPQFTIIQGFHVAGPYYNYGTGDGAIRCVYLTNGASLLGFTLTNGATRAVNDYPNYRESTGGGLWCESTNAVVVSNCVVAGNSAYHYGGGGYQGTLNNCTLSSNSVAYSGGGGASGGMLNNCTLSGNWAFGDGGGAAGCTLNVCTLTANSVHYDGVGGGAAVSTLNGCTLTSNSGGYYGGGAYGGTLNDCTLSNNQANVGGGAADSTLSNCTLNGNSAVSGGGAYSGTLNHCTLSGNGANYGGGANCCTLSNCTLSSNSGYYAGGGAYQATLNNCTLRGNSASSTYGYGGGTYQGTLNNCTLSGNSAYNGGGAYQGLLNNCTVTGNSAYANAGGLGGGAYGSTNNNCILYFNTGAYGANYDSSSTLNYCCTTPLPTGTGNISLDPQLASASHLSAGSPCRGAGNAAYANGTDIDGEPWASPPSVGCDEYHAGALTGQLTVGITAAFTNVAVGFAVGLTGQVEGRAAASLWDFGDGVTVTNHPFTSHTWTVPGDFRVVLRAYNESQPGGISATVTVQVVAQPVHYVSIAGVNPVAPYTSWATAATNIQDAVDAATVPGALVLVTNGIYATGGRIGSVATANRAAVDKPLNVGSVNGPQVTTICGSYGVNGSYAVRCVYLTNGASLSGFTLTNGSAVEGGGAYGGTLNDCTLSGNSAQAPPYSQASGGGAIYSTLNSCLLTGNSANNSGGGASYSTLNNCALNGNVATNNGGGAVYSTLNDCTLSGNSTGYGGGGAAGSTLDNCTLSANSAYAGGGAYFGTLNNCSLMGNSSDNGGGAISCTLNNCIVYFNTAPNGADYAGGTLNNCCTTPLPASGTGNITNGPLFVDTNGWANLRPQSNSPCINAGNNSYVTNATDLDGNPRIAGGTVDIGAYEFQAPVSRISYAWLQQFNLPINPAADTTDPDGDGVDNYHEWLAGTDPTDPLSSSAQLTIIPSGVPPSEIILTWSTNAVGFTLQSTTNLVPPVVWITNSPAPVVVNGQNAVTNPISGAHKYYRLIQ